MRAMILCAGLGTRLGKLGAERPKPMLPVCGLPILRFGVANLVGHGVRDLVINTHHLGDVIRAELGDGSRLGARIQYIHEPQLLGTGGGLKHALALLDPAGTDEPFLSINGKLIFDLDITALAAAFAAAPAGTLGMMVVRRVPDAVAWGALDVRPDAHGLRIHDILGSGEHMFCGAHVTRPSVMARLPDGESDSIRQGYLPWLRAGERVAAYEHAAGYFAEHSTPERYLQSNWDLLDGAPLRFPPTHLGGVDRTAPPSGGAAGGARVPAIDPTARIHPSATLVPPLSIGAGATIGADVTVGPYAVVGAGAHVTRSLARTVVWPGATADATTAGDAVVT